MTLPDLLTLSLCRIHKDFYINREREFHRDYTALTKAIARYGYECAKRNWHLEPAAIYRDIHKLLSGVLKRRDEIEYLPAYLDSAIRSHIGLRSEEIQAQALTSGVTRKVAKVVEGTQVVAKVVSTDTELLAALHTSIQRRKAQPKPKPTPAIKQYEFQI
jgi:hypothetical protein